MSVDLTWDEVRARSEVGGLFCYACSINFDTIKMPCLKHCISDEERDERDRRFKPIFDDQIKQWKAMLNGR